MTELDLRDATLVGFSLGTGELARYVGSLRHRPAARRCVFIESLAPSFAKSDENPKGVDPAGVAGVQQAILDDRFAWLTGAARRLPQPRRLPRQAGQRGDRARASGTPGAEASPIATWACPPGWLEDFGEDIKRIDVPTLILHGTADRILPIDGQGRRLHAALPDAHYVEIEGGPHVMCVTHAEEVNRELLAFLREPSPSAPPPDAERERRLHPWPSNPASCSSRPPRASSTRPRSHRSSTSSSPPAPARCSTTCRPAPIDKLRVDEQWITVPADVGDVARPHRQARGATGALPVDPLHARRRLDPRQRRAPTTGSSASWPSAPTPRVRVRRVPTARPRPATRSRSSRPTRPPSGSSANGAAKGLDASRMAVAGDSVGGNMAAALTLMAKQRGDVTFVHQSMYYPVTDAAHGHRAPTTSSPRATTSPRKAMEWFWDAYTTDPRSAPRSPPRRYRASLEQLAGLPPTLVIVDEADVAARRGRGLRAPSSARPASPYHQVRYDGIIHDFMMLDAMRDANATRAAIAQAVAFLRSAPPEGSTDTMTAHRSTSWPRT